MADKRQVTAAQAQEFADKNQMVYIEASATDDAFADDVDEIFMTILRKLQV